ncbi:asparagine synthase [Gracilibacillus halophilus YIM-C55.5]|uniref:asparagine synthase (glutamine-hydrolyzing) n=1 Tax=Gracilibacillus halophilus YIM-C55.5 TaxID=1308866 RepID=N4WD21_9BACI|nr:asparagine synthase (glutamine-hydrolyzing) [Gracilibacillus halophilus]ENH97129.1 asparagine synthase [Gracilibacillus halophilus YIM-C55.5]
MCGFIGIMKNQPSKEFEEYNYRNQMIYHRGPDDEGYYQDDYVAFGFRRLSIIDIESGHQPFPYDDERYWMVFNGEIYNFIELRNQLMEQGHTFLTDSDSEVVVAMFDVYGTEAFQYLRGMFAILIWDKQEATLYGARDPFGIKPLYYKESEQGTYFGSEKKSIISAEDTVDVKALQNYLTFQYVPEPDTMHQSIKKLEPGHYFVKQPGEEMIFTRYFHAFFQPSVKQEENVWIDKIQQVMYDSVDVHLRSDVPVGSFLSGGIDSSLIVSIAKYYHPEIKTFSVGFEQNGYSEMDVAKETADRLGVENYRYVISPEEYMDQLPSIIWHLDDPLADPACVPLYFVAREAKKHVTVALSGEGADELFTGYNIYREPESLKMFQSIPNPLNKMLGWIANTLPEGVKGKSFLERGTTPLSDRYIGNAKIFEEKAKQQMLVQYDKNQPYQKVTRPLYQQVKDSHFVHQMQYVDIHTWLRGDILLKADKMSMAHSLELRVPFLDQEVFKVARQIPAELNIAQGTTKHILRQAARGIVPDHVLDRKKLGFPVPIRHWLKNEIYDWTLQLIRESETDHLLHKPMIEQMLENHRLGKADYSRKLWTVIVFMLWHQIFIENKYDFDKLQTENKKESKLV